MPSCWPARAAGRSRARGSAMRGQQQQTRRPELAGRVDDENQEEQDLPAEHACASITEHAGRDDNSSNRA